MDKQIFISYSHSDRQMVDRIVEIIRETSGRACWYDPELIGGDQYFKHIANQILNCTEFVFIVSEGSIASDWCLKEITYAMGKHKRIIPIWLDANVRIPAEIEMAIQDVQYLYYEDSDSFREAVRRTFAGDSDSQGQQEQSAHPVRQFARFVWNLGSLVHSLVILALCVFAFLLLYHTIKSSKSSVSNADSDTAAVAGTMDSAVEAEESVATASDTDAALLSENAAAQAQILEAASALVETGEILDLTEDERAFPIAIENAQVLRMSVGGPEVHSNDYELVAQTDGTYHLWCENVQIANLAENPDEYVYMHITVSSGEEIASCSFYDSRSNHDQQPGSAGETEGGWWISSDAQGITLEDVHAGDVFLVETDAVDGTTYDLCIGEPRDIEENIAGAGGHTTVSASMTYQDQSDVYTYAPSVGSSAVPRGTVRFTVTPAQQEAMRLDIRDAEGNLLQLYPEYGSDGSVGCTLQTNGDPYTVTVSDDSTSFDAAYAYTLDVRQVLHWQSIDAYVGVHDRISFTEQINVYSYTATASGSYSIAFPALAGDWTDDGRLYVYVYTRDEYEAGGTPRFGEYIDADNSICRANLVAGCDYIIEVVQATDCPEYTMVMIAP